MQGEMIFLDTSFIIAFFNKKDKHYADAQQTITQTMEHNKEILFVYSDFIFDEVITLLKSKKVPVEKILQIGDQLLSSDIWKLVVITEDQFYQTWQYTKTYRDKMWSFTDVASFVLMEEMEITYYLSYDNHFAQNPQIERWYPQ